MEFKLPDLSPTAAGAPAVWNRAENVRDWEKQALWYVHPVLPDYNNECEVLKAFFAFFAQTPESIRQTAHEALGETDMFPQQWYRFAWLQFYHDEYQLQNHKDEWVKAWRGTKIEALYSIIVSDASLKAGTR